MSCFCSRYLVLSLQTCPCSNLSVIKTGAVRSHSQLHMYLVFPLSLHQIISRLPVTWLADGATVTRPLQGVVIYLTHLAQELLRGSIGHPDHLRLKTRFGLFLSYTCDVVKLSLSLSLSLSVPRALVKEISGQLARLGATSESQSLCL